MPDVRLYLTPDGGNVDVHAGQFDLADGLETSVVLSLFGGNSDDSGSAGDDSKQWWGNLTETDPARIYRSETQAFLTERPATSGNLALLEECAERDLEWMKSYGAEEITVTATLPSLDRVSLVIAIVINNEERRFTFSPTWQVTQ